MAEYTTKQKRKFLEELKGTVPTTVLAELNGIDQTTGMKWARDAYPDGRPNVEIRGRQGQKHQNKLRNDPDVDEICGLMRQWDRLPPKSRMARLLKWANVE